MLQVWPFLFFLFMLLHLSLKDTAHNPKLAVKTPSPSCEQPTILAVLFSSSAEYFALICLASFIYRNQQQPQGVVLKPFSLKHFAHKKNPKTTESMIVITVFPSVIICSQMRKKIIISNSNEHVAVSSIISKRYTWISDNSVGRQVIHNCSDYSQRELKPTSVCLIVAKSFDETSFNNEAALNQKLANRRPRKRQATPQRDAHKEQGTREIEARGREG